MNICIFFFFATVTQGRKKKETVEQYLPSLKSVQVIQSQLLGVLPQHSPNSSIPSQQGNIEVGVHWAGFKGKKKTAWEGGEEVRR